MNKHPLDHPGAQAVRNRRVLIAKKLSEIKMRYGNHPGEKCKVLSVACGPAFELNDLLSSPEDCDVFNFSLLDQDKYALLEAAIIVDHLEKKLGRRIKVNYLNESVRTMLATPHLEGKWGQFDFVYSMGLFDYLTPPVASAVIKKLYELLIPGGEMVIGNFHVSNPSRHYMEYWLDWVLYYRNELEFKELLGGISSAETKVSFEDTKVQMFLHVRKNV